MPTKFRNSSTTSLYNFLSSLPFQNKTNITLKKVLITVLFVITICFSPLTSSGQNRHTMDSLQTQYSVCKSDTQKVNLLLEIASLYLNSRSPSSAIRGKTDSTIEYCSKALFLSQKAGFKLGVAKSYRMSGWWHFNKGSGSKALECFNNALKIDEEIGRKDRMIDEYENIGNCYHIQSDYSKAVDSFFRSLKIAEEIGDKKNRIRIYNRIGVLYYIQENYLESIKYYLQVSKLSKEIGFKDGILESSGNCAVSYYELGNVSRKQGDSIKANEYFAKATAGYNETCRLAIEFGDKQGIISLNGYFAKMDMYQKNYPAALKKYQDCLNAYHEMGLEEDSDPVLQCYIGMGKVLIEQGKYQEALNYFNKATGKSIDKIFLQDKYSGLSELYAKTGRDKDALKYYKLFIQIKDSISGGEIATKLTKLQNQFQKEKEEKTAKLEAARLEEVNAAESRKHKFIIVFVAIGLLLVTIFSGFIFRSLAVTRKQKTVIEIQKKEVESQKYLVEEHRQEIVDSITYAKRLQQAVLPSLLSIKQNLPSSFLLYRPKDIVAGDFYWMHTFNDTVLIAACDCTGHGVPGAMVSIVCSNALNRTVNEFGLTETGKILDKVTELVLETFAKSGEEINDGMDISLLSVNKTSRQIQWSGANNPLWIANGSTLTEIKPDKQPIGKSEHRVLFTTQTVPYVKGEDIYLITDGYADQFGRNDKKLMKKKFKELILSIQDKTMEEQKMFLDEYHTNWKDGMEQTDDVTIIGIHIS